MPTEIFAPAAMASKRHEVGGHVAQTEGGARDAAAWRAARSFEAVFIAEMMSHAGAADAGGALGSGDGGFAEQTFRSLLSREWAEDLADRGGVGLAEQIYRSIVGDGLR